LISPVVQHPLFDAGNALHRPAAGWTGLNVDVKDAFQALRPGKGGPAFGRRSFSKLV
jgi:hypothetical protein